MSRTQNPDGQGERVDASRRTYLAEERTYLAWLRSGLAAIAVSLAVGRLLPELLDQDQAAYRLLGIGYGIFALFLLTYGVFRQRSMDRALASGKFRPLPTWVLVVLGGSTLILGLATIWTLFSGL